jgi:hypothetical protein
VVWVVDTAEVIKSAFPVQPVVFPFLVMAVAVVVKIATVVVGKVMELAGLLVR